MASISNFLSPTPTGAPAGGGGGGGGTATPAGQTTLDGMPKSCLQRLQSSWNRNGIGFNISAGQGSTVMNVGNSAPATNLVNVTGSGRLNYVYLNADYNFTTRNRAGGFTGGSLIITIDGGTPVTYSMPNSLTFDTRNVTNQTGRLGNTLIVGAYAHLGYAAWRQAGNNSSGGVESVSTPNFAGYPNFGVGTGTYNGDIYTGIIGRSFEDTRSNRTFQGYQTNAVHFLGTDEHATYGLPFVPYETSLLVQYTGPTSAVGGTAGHTAGVNFTNTP